MNLLDLGNRIRKQRERRGLKQSDIAHALQISAQAVSKWERGENAPDIAVLLDLAKILGVTSDWILGRGDQDRDTFEATVLCTSMNGFAEFASRSPPREVAARANGFFHLLTEAVLRFEGVPVKYVGDGFLAFFSGAQHALRAVQAALHGKDMVGSRDLVVMLHAGDIYLGAIGHTEYSRPDITGQTVNTAFLAMGWVAANVPEGLALSGEVAARLGADSPVRKLKRMSVKGVPGGLDLFVPVSTKPKAEKRGGA
ncbi:MAG: helix-turn-helix domain-containing protein [Planctomycetes bacterium]|nr:helix-turn-helix domain-containing protein [Planctomycetota bacterium]